MKIDKEKSKEFIVYIFKGAMVASIIFIMWLVTIVYTMGLFTLLLAGFETGGKTFLYILFGVSYLILLWGAFMLPYYRAYASYLTIKKEKEVKK